MGIYNRDYLREDQPRGLARPDVTVIPWLIGINVILFLLDSASRFRLQEWLELDLQELWPIPEAWRLLTYGFCHGNTGHIFFNMYALWLFGKFVEPIYRAREFLAFYLVGILISGVAFLLFAATQPDRHLVTVGASGGVMAVTILTAMQFPRTEILMMFVLPIQLRYLALVTVIIDVAGMFNQGGHVANAAHLGGAAFGYVYFKAGWNLTNWRFPWRAPSFRRQPKVRIYDPDAEAESSVVSASEVDRLLQKISQQGEASLTDSERATLEDASRQARRRQNRS